MQISTVKLCKSTGIFIKVPPRVFFGRGFGAIRDIQNLQWGISFGSKKQTNNKVREINRNLSLKYAILLNLTDLAL
jgi:hypothetical protein